MDFAEGLAKSGGKSLIFEMVDKLSMATSWHFTTVQVVKTFLDNVFKLHGVPETIISDQDCVFLSVFWQFDPKAQIST